MEQNIDISQPEFGLRLRRLRTDKGMAQRDLAGSQITSSYISLIESGKRVPTLNVVLLLAQKLDVPVSVLLDRPAEQLAPRKEPRHDLTSTFQHALNTLEMDAYEEALPLLQEAYREALRTDDDRHLVQVGNTLNHVLQVLHLHDKRVTLYREMLTSPRINHQPTLRISALTGLAAALRDSGAFHEAKEIALKARPIAEEPQIRGSVEHIKLLGILVSILCELDAVHEIPSPLRELLELSRALGQKGVVGRSNWVSSRAYAIIGDHDAAYTSLQVALENLRFQDMSTREWIRFSRSIAATLLTIERDLPLAERWLRNAETAAEMLLADDEKPAIQVMRARLRLLGDEPGEVVKIHQELALRPDALPDRLWAELQETAAEALLRLGEADACVRMLRDCAASWEAAGDYQRAVAAWKRIDQATENEDQG